MKILFRNARVVCAIALLAACPSARMAFGQTGGGDLVGTISDQSGASVAAADVQAENRDTGVKSSTVSSEAGTYRIANLLPGMYRIRASAPGFAQTTLENVGVEVNKVATVNLTMQINAVSSTIEVREAATAIDTTTASIQSSFESQAARDLPVTSIGLGSVNLALLNAGVASNGGIGVGEGPSVGGQRPYNNNFMVEGIDNNNKGVTGSLLRFIPNDAVQEFTIQQNQMSAEFGHSSGGQFNTVVRSGTNQVHGTLYEYLQNRNLNAIDQAVQNAAIQTGSRPENTRYDVNRIGASVGGPIIKDKWFYFGDFEYEPVGAASVNTGITTPTSEGLNVLSGLPGLSQNNFDIFKKYVPVAPIASGTITTTSGLQVPVGTPSISAPNYQNNYAAVASSDYTISNNDTLRGRFLYNRLGQIDTNVQLPVFAQLDVGNYYLATISEYHTFSPSLINELRLGYNRLNQVFPAGNFSYPGLDAFPTLIFDDIGLSVGPDSVTPQGAVQNMYQIADNLSWTVHNHTLKFGVEGRKYIAPASFTQRSRGEYEYSSLELFLRDIQPDTEAERGVGNVVYYGDQSAVYSYVNDSWRLRPNFTLNLGLRHEFTSVPYSERLQTLNRISDTPGVLTFIKPQPQWKNFAPRIGIAYSPGRAGTTSIRAGFGMAYDVLFDNIGQLSVPPQLGSTIDQPNTGSPLSGLPNYLGNGGIPPNASAGSLSREQAIAATSAYIPNQKLPYSIQWNVGIQHVFVNDYTVEARYLGTRGVHLDVQQRINIQSVVTPDNNIPTFIAMPDQAALAGLTRTLLDVENARSNILPRFENAGFVSNITENSPIGNSTYHGLALQVTRRFSKGLQFVGAYTWSHLIDDSTADFFTTLLTPRRPQDFQNLRADRSSSALDHRHRITLTMMYEVPWFKRSNWFLKNLVGNWTVAPIYTYESPELVTVQSQADSNLNGDPFGDRTIVNPAGQSGVGSDVTPICLGGALCDFNADDSQIVGYVANNPNARYIVAQRGTIANGGRNTLSGRPINNWDLNLLKNFNINERVRFQLSAQAYNLFNHPQFIPGFTNRVDNPVVLNTSGGIWNYVTPGTPIFNNPEAVYSSTPRGVQIAAKVIF